jgi:hypothetical protein
VTIRSLEELDPDRDGGPPHAVDRAFLDGLDWVYESRAKQLLGLTLRVRCDDEQLGRFLHAFLAAYPAAAPDAVAIALDVAHARGRWIAYLGGRRTSGHATREEMARSLVWDLNVAALGAPTDHLHIHAAVAAREGGAVVIAGVSGAGKSTLVTALAGEPDGWTYFSDEVADIDADNRVHPYPRPIALDPGSWPLLPELSTRWPVGVPRLVSDLRLVLPASLGSPSAAGPVPVRTIVFPEVRPGAATELLPLQRAEALERLVPVTLNLRPHGVAGFERLGALVAATTCHRLVLDGVDDAPRVFLKFR